MISEGWGFVWKGLVLFYKEIVESLLSHSVLEKDEVMWGHTEATYKAREEASEWNLPF